MDKKLVLAQLKQMVHQQNYSSWNETSTNLMKLIIEDKTNNEEMKDLARKVFEEYHAWKNTQ
jgi:hypothetical protein